MHRGSRCLRHPHHPHGHPRLCGLFALILPFYFLLYLPLLFLFLTYMKSMVNLHNSCNEGVDASDDLLLSTGYEPKAHDIYETTVEPYVQLLNSPALLSNTTPAADPDCDDSTLEDMLYQAHRVQADHLVREDLFVSLSSSSMSDRTGQPVGDRSGQPGEHRSSEAQIRTLLDDQEEQILAECQAKINQHEFQAARAEEEQRLLQGQLLQQKLEFREFHQRSLTEIEELRNSKSSAFDTMARRKFIEDQNTTLELSGQVQELQNEVNCMTDSKDFQDAESIRSGNSHVTSRPVSFPPHPILEGCLNIPSYRRAAKKGRQAFGTHMVYRETFLQIQMHHQHLILKNCISGIHRSKSRSIHPQWRKVKGKNKIKI